MRPTPTKLMLAGAVVIFCAATIAAQSMPKLRDGLLIKQSGDSPGRVTFNHATHVDSARPDCTGCHPRLFRILEPQSVSKPAPVTHERMQKGESCGACHNGKKAFALDDDCTNCHT